MSNKFPSDIPEGRSIIDDRIALFNIEAIANATSLDELKATTKTTLDDLIRVEEIIILKKLQSIAKALQKDLNNSKLIGEMNETFIKVERKHSIKTGRHALGSVYYQDYDSFLPARQDLINEYQVKTPSELLVIDTALVAYFRYIRATKIFNSCMENINDDREENQIKANTMRELNKTMDIANQQMIMAFTFLKESRRQPVQVKIQTQKAYFAQNQQINEDKP